MTRLLTDGHTAVGLANTDGDPIDLRDGDAVDDCIRRESPEMIFHLGGVSGPMQLADDEIAVLRINGEGTLNVLRSAAANNVRRVINASSVAGYVHSGKSGPEPDSIYGATKRLGEMLSRIYSRRGLLETTNVRIGSVYGIGRMTNNPIHDMVRDAITKGRIKFHDTKMEPCIEVRACVRMLAGLVGADALDESYDAMTDRPSVGDVVKIICDVTGADQFNETRGALPEFEYPMPFDPEPLLKLAGVDARISLREGITDLVKGIAEQLGVTGLRARESAGEEAIGNA